MESKYEREHKLCSNGRAIALWLIYDRKKPAFLGKVNRN